MKQIIFLFAILLLLIQTLSAQNVNTKILLQESQDINNLSCLSQSTIELAQRLGYKAQSFATYMLLFEDERDKDSPRLISNLIKKVGTGEFDKDKKFLETYNNYQKKKTPSSPELRYIMIFFTLIMSPNSYMVKEKHKLDHFKKYFGDDLGPVAYKLHQKNNDFAIPLSKKIAYERIFYSLDQNGCDNFIKK